MQEAAAPSVWKLVEAAPVQKPPYKSDLRKVPLIGGLLGYLDENFAEPGVDRATKGAQQMLAPPTADKSRGQNIVGGASEMARGLGQAMAPPFIASGLGAPIKLAAALGTGIVAQQATEKGLKVVGVPDEYANAAGDVAGVMAGSRGHEAVTGVVNAVRAAKDSAGSMADVLLHPATREAIGIASPRTKHILDLAARAKKATDAFKGEEPKTPSTPGELTPGQRLAKDTGADWSKLSKDDQATLEHVARAQAAAQPAPQQAAPPVVEEPPAVPAPGTAQTAADIRSRILSPQPGPPPPGGITPGAQFPAPPAPSISGDAIRTQNADALARLQQEQAARTQPVQAQPAAPTPTAPVVTPPSPSVAPPAEAALGASRPVVESPQSGYTAAGDPKSPQLRAAEITAKNTTNKAKRFAEQMAAKGVTADIAEQMQAGRVSEAQIGQGAAPRWGNLADFIGETEPKSSVPEIIAELRKMEAAEESPPTVKDSLTVQPAKSARDMTRAELAKQAGLPENATTEQIMKALADAMEEEKPKAAAAGKGKK